MVLRFGVPMWRRVTRRQLIAVASAVGGGSAVGLAAVKLLGVDGDPSPAIGEPNIASDATVTAERRPRGAASLR